MRRLSLATRTRAQAIFFIGTGSTAHCTSTNHWANTRVRGERNHCEAYARAAHEGFLRRYGRTEGEVRC